MKMTPSIIADETLSDGTRNITAMTSGVCSQMIMVSLKGDTVLNVQYLGGCHGNTQGISQLCRGMKAQDIRERLQGIRCGSKSTSCPDQLAQILEIISKEA